MAGSEPQKSSSGERQECEEDDRGGTTVQRHSPCNKSPLLRFPAKCDTDLIRVFDSSLVENDMKSDRNPFIFLANAMEIP